MNTNEPLQPPGASRATAPTWPAGDADDKVFRGFLELQRQQGMALAKQSDVLRLSPMGGSPPQHYLAEFTCPGVARVRSGEVVISRRSHLVGIFFPRDYLRRAEASQVLTWLEPVNVYSPHIAPPFICTGRIHPGTLLVDLLFQVYEVILFYKVTPREDDALNKAACSWARKNLARFPLDRTPLKRRTDPSPVPVRQEQSP